MGLRKLEEDGRGVRGMKRSGSRETLRIGRRACGLLTLALAGALVSAGCGRLHPKPADKYVYVTAKQAFLRDRVAAVSNRTGTVSNGDKLVVLERSRRFVKVRTGRGEVGWIEEKLTADQGLVDQFEELKSRHGHDATVATATVRDEVVLHVAPGRLSPSFYRLQEGDKLSLLTRATVAKPLPPGSAPARSAEAAASPAPPKADAGSAAEKKPAAGSVEKKAGEKGAAEAPAGPVMEDWWLVRNAHGETGWIYGRMMDVDEPDVLARYSEGQRIVGAYILTHVEDPESNMVSNGQTITSIPEYVTVLSPFKAGLPYDFDQVRVFIWNLKKHRYETAFRERNIAGYLPVEISQRTDPYTKGPLAATPLPAFSYHVLAGGVPLPVPDPQTGTITPGKTLVKTYRLEGNICRRLIPQGMPAPEEAHPEPVSEKKKKR